MHKKTKITIASIALAFLILSLAFFLTLFDKGIYDKSFTQSGVYDELGVQGVRGTVDYLIKYLVSESTGQDGMQLFYEEERDHLKDVKMIVLIVKYLSIASFLALILIFYFENKKRSELAKRALLLGGVGALASLLALFLLSLNFSWFWEVFHVVLFPQGNYSFPSHYLLIKLFPEEFFRGFALKFFAHAAVLGLATIGLSFAYNKQQ